MCSSYAGEPRVSVGFGIGFGIGFDVEEDGMVARRLLVDVPM